MGTSYGGARCGRIWGLRGGGEEEERERAREREVIAAHTVVAGGGGVDLMWAMLGVCDQEQGFRLGADFRHIHQAM